MKRFAACCALILTVTGRLPAADAMRPNVVFIIADDMNRRLPVYGDSLVKAPNVERLAKRAVRFDRAYCQYPVCSPSRVSFLSGRRPEHTGMYGNEGSSRTPLLQDAIFLPELFKSQGYWTARLGKVFHIGRDVSECWNLSEEGTPGDRIVYQPQELDKLQLGPNVVAQHRLKGVGGEGASGAILSGGKDQLIDVRNGRRAAELIAARAAEAQPFFLACGFRRPHLPHLAPQEDYDVYPAASLPLPESGGPSLVKHKPPAAEADIRESLRGYLAAMTFMDEQLGLVLDALDAGDLWRNTIVVFLGDHGYLLGTRGGWWGKGILYDEAAATTLLIAAPGMASDSASPRVVEFLDLYPTLADLCDLHAPPGLEGRSLKPLLHKPDLAWEHPAYTMIARDGKPVGLAVTLDRWRYLENADGSVELFDLQTDPREWHDLANDPAHATTFAELHQRAQDYKKIFRP
jgi:uncharacterized sulfatase